MESKKSLKCVSQLSNKQQKKPSTKHSCYNCIDKIAKKEKKIQLENLFLAQTQYDK